jgi:hypothetical protein
MPVLATTYQICLERRCGAPEPKGGDFLTSTSEIDMHLAMHVATIQFHQIVLSVVLVDTDLVRPLSTLAMILTL